MCPIRGVRVVDVPALADLAPYQPQTTCSPRPKPGVVGFQRIVLASFPATGSAGISRACSIGGRSEHKEGRAWDWAVTVSNPNPHTDHVHFSFSWAGARKQTSYWGRDPGHLRPPRLSRDSPAPD